MDCSYSVIVPCYNAERTLGKVLRHIEALEPLPREILVVDDGSSDGTVGIASDRAGVKLIRLEKNLGPAVARNAGAREAGGEWLLFVDSDCYVPSASFRNGLSLLAARPELAGVMGVYSRNSPAGPFAGVYKNYFRHLEIAEMRNPPPEFSSSCFMIRRSTFLEIGGFDEAFERQPTEDNEFYFRLVRRGHTLPYLMAFDFIHDKKLTARQMFNEDRQRATAMLWNLTGRLGERGMTWTLREKTIWILSIISGNLVCLGLALPLLLLAAGLPSSAAWLVWTAAAATFGLLLRTKLAFARRERGISFAARLYGLRAFEMVAAVAGCLRGLLPRSMPRKVA